MTTIERTFEKVFHGSIGYQMTGGPRYYSKVNYKADLVDEDGEPDYFVDDYIIPDDDSHETILGIMNESIIQGKDLLYERYKDSPYPSPPPGILY